MAEDADSRDGSIDSDETLWDHGDFEESDASLSSYESVEIEIGGTTAFDGLIKVTESRDESIDSEETFWSPSDLDQSDDSHNTNQGNKSIAASENSINSEPDLSIGDTDSDTENGNSNAHSNFICSQSILKSLIIMRILNCFIDGEAHLERRILQLLPWRPSTVKYVAQSSLSKRSNISNDVLVLSHLSNEITANENLSSVAHDGDRPNVSNVPQSNGANVLELLHLTNEVTANEELSLAANDDDQQSGNNETKRNISINITPSNILFILYF